jgi:hypothetical protein
MNRRSLFSWLASVPLVGAFAKTTQGSGGELPNDYYVVFDGKAVVISTSKILEIGLEAVGRRAALTRAARAPYDTVSRERNLRDYLYYDAALEKSLDDVMPSRLFEPSV